MTSTNRQWIASEVSSLGAGHGCHTGVEWALNGRGRSFHGREWASDSPAIHRLSPMIFNEKKTLHCTDGFTYHVTSPVQCNGLFKRKSLYGMGFRIRITSLQYTTRPLVHYTALPLLHCTVLTTLHHHYSTTLYSLHCTFLTALYHHYYTALYSLHCTTTIPLHCTHYTTLYSLHCITTTPLHCTTITPLHCTYYTAPPLPHSTVGTMLHYTQYTALYLLHCTVLTTLHHHFSTALHCTHFTVCSDPHLIKEPKILWRDINKNSQFTESFKWVQIGTLFLLC